MRVVGKTERRLEDGLFVHVWHVELDDNTTVQAMARADNPFTEDRILASVQTYINNMSKIQERRDNR